MFFSLRLRPTSSSSHRKQPVQASGRRVLHGQDGAMAEWQTDRNSLEFSSQLPQERLAMFQTGDPFTYGSDRTILVSVKHQQGVHTKGRSGTWGEGPHC